MNSQDAKKIISKLPYTPGVYFFKRGKEILYIGKATSLRDRVRNYFGAGIGNTRSPLISKMLSEFDTISFQKTDSVLEALILEANLIKKYQPEANIKEKDNRSFNFVIVTKEDFPRVLVIRERELHNSFKEPIKYSFGPFTNSGQLKEAIKIVRKLFPFRDKCVPCDLHMGTLCRPCFNRQIGLCPGVCTGEITKSDYAKIIRNIVLFFEGNKKQIKKNLEKQMKEFAKAQEFEKAQKVKRTIFALNHIQDVALIKDNNTQGETSRKGIFRIESYDIAHISGTNVVGVMVVVEDGEIKKSDYRKFRIKDDPSVNDTKALSEVLNRRLAHIEWPMPDLIVGDGGKAQKNLIERILKNNLLKIPVVSVVKDEHHRPKEILGDRSILLTTSKKWPELEREILLSNSEAHRFAINYHKNLRNKI
jgi:excinuclease ABC subunit C